MKTDTRSPAEVADHCEIIALETAYVGNRCTECDVDMWDEPNGSENTVSSLVRRYTAQWGLPLAGEPNK